MGLNKPLHSEHELTIVGVPEKLARVYCRARKITQQPCDGTCGDCKKNFKSYINETLQVIVPSQGEPSGFGPDEEVILTEAECRKMLEDRVKNWIEIKKRIIQERQVINSESTALNQYVAQRIAFLEELASIPDDIIDQGMATQQ